MRESLNDTMQRQGHAVNHASIEQLERRLTELERRLNCVIRIPPLPHPQPVQPPPLPVVHYPGVGRGNTCPECTLPWRRRYPSSRWSERSPLWTHECAQGHLWETGRHPTSASSGSHY